MIQLGNYIVKWSARTLGVTSVWRSQGACTEDVSWGEFWRIDGNEQNVSKSKSLFQVKKKKKTVHEQDLLNMNLWKHIKWKLLLYLAKHHEYRSFLGIVEGCKFPEISSFLN